MYPDSEIKKEYKIARAPEKQIREPKPLTEIHLIDPATGSGNFLLYAFDLFYDLYLDQIENYGADYDENQIAKLIIENNLYGIDLDNRAVHWRNSAYTSKPNGENEAFALSISTW